MRVVDSIGEGVTRFARRTRHLNLLLPGMDRRQAAGRRAICPIKRPVDTSVRMLAEYVIVSENALVASLKAWMRLRLCTLPCAGLTAWFALVERGHLRAAIGAGTRTGGVALFALQIAKAHGAEVIVTSGSDENWRGPKSWGPARASTD